MTSGYAPDRLRERHLLMAYMVIGGASNQAIADKLSYTYNRVSIIRNSPLFQAYLGQLRRDLEEQTVGDIAKWIHEETPKTLHRLGELRDQDDELGVALGAVKEILARGAPITTKVQEERTVRVLIAADERRAMEAVLVEDGPTVIDVEPDGDDEATPAPRAPALQTVEEALAEIRAGE